MELVYRLCAAISFGIILGFLGGGIKAATRRDDRAASEGMRKTQKVIAGFLKYVTFLFLLLGLIWCAYFLILGAFDPGQAEYATNMSQLIVSVLTIVSILFAFFEFVRKK